MPLVSCAACERQISTQAVSCPQCGHPNRAPGQPACYACSTIATTRCANCGVFSCAQHLKNVAVYHSAEHGCSSSHELNCETCITRAEALRKSPRWPLALVALLFVLSMVGLAVAFAVFVPSPSIPSAGPSQVEPVNVRERTEAGGVALTVEKVDRRAKLGRYEKARPGHEFLVAEVVIETTSRDQAPYNVHYFSVKDANGFVHGPSATFALPEHLPSGTLARGEKVRGAVAFDVEQGAKGLVLRYQPAGYPAIPSLAVALD